MKDTPNNVIRSLVPETNSNEIQRRIFRAMSIAVALGVLASLPFAQWRITTGLLLGGLLSLLNHHWLSNSTAAAFRVLLHGEKPRLSIAQYLLRYLVIAAVVAGAYKLNLVSLAATIAGLCSFVVALFAEAFREFYFAIIHREGVS